MSAKELKEVLDGDEGVNNSVELSETATSAATTIESLRDVIASLSFHALDYSPDWANIDPESIPAIKVRPPGPLSQCLHGLANLHTKGFSSQVSEFPVVFERAHGVTMEDVDGNQYLDFSSGIVVANIGHSHPKVVAAVSKAAANMMNCHDFTTAPKALLLEKLSKLFPNFSVFQLYPAGTDAVEAGLRMAKEITGKSGVLGLNMGFHGKTLGAISITRPHPDQTQGYYQAPRPRCFRCDLNLSYNDCSIQCAHSIEQTLKQHPDIGVVVVEPIQGWAGAQTPPEEYMPILREICDRKGVLLMADEILTGMGRTGKMLAMEHWGVVPDITTIGKGLGNGFPVAATLLHAKYRDKLGNLSASTTFGGNPMACAAALAVLDVFEQEQIVERGRKLGDFLMQKLKELQYRHPIVGDVRGKGCYLGVEIVIDRETNTPFQKAATLIYRKAFEKGLAWIPAGNTLRIAPPLIMSEEIAEKGMLIIEEAIMETERELNL